MRELPFELYRAAQVRELDRIAIEDRGIPGYTLMNRAGAAAFDLLRQRWPRARRIVVVCGGGNNGGDGYVVARLARKAGLDVLLVHPRLVQTGLDLIDFPTIVWQEVEYSVYTMRQASRRSWRIGQRRPVRVVNGASVPPHAGTHSGCGTASVLKAAPFPQNSCRSSPRPPCGRGRQDRAHRHYPCA